MYALFVLGAVVRVVGWTKFTCSASTTGLSIPRAEVDYAALCRDRRRRTLALSSWIERHHALIGVPLALRTDAAACWGVQRERRTVPFLAQSERRRRALNAR